MLWSLLQEVPEVMVKSSSATEPGGKGGLGQNGLKLDSSVFAGRTVRLTGATAGGNGQNAKTDGRIVSGGNGGRGFYSGSDGLGSGDTSVRWSWWCRWRRWRWRCCVRIICSQS